MDKQYTKEGRKGKLENKIMRGGCYTLDVVDFNTTLVLYSVVFASGITA